MATSDVMTCFKVQINKTSVVLLDINCICVSCYVWYISVNNLIFCIVWFLFIFMFYILFIMEN